MDDNEMKQAEEVLPDVSKALVELGKNAYRLGVIAGVGAVSIGIGIGHLMIFLPKTIKNRKKNETK